LLITIVTLGPNSPVGNGPVLIAIEYQVEYIIQMLSKFQKENLRSFDVKTEAVDDFGVWKDQYMKDTSKPQPTALLPTGVISFIC
jgi:cyclohexanone monooxygenase